VRASAPIQKQVPQIAEEQFSGPEQLEDCSGNKEDKTRNARNYSDDME
jgi:hypothetical protein